MNPQKLRSPLAVCFGLACIIGTVIVLFGHIRSIDDLTISHLYILLSLTVAFGAGHFMWDAFENGLSGMLTGISFTLLFIISTVVCVGFSAGRSADIIEQRERDAVQEDKRRAELKVDVDNAERHYNELKKRADEARARATQASDQVMDQCGTGKGSRCAGTRDGYATLEQTAAIAEQAAQKALTDYFLIKNKLSELPASPTANGDLKHIARVWAMLSGKSEAEAFIQLKLLLPYALALLTEFGAIVFLKHGTAKRDIPPPQPLAPPVSLTDIAEELKIDTRLARKMLRAANEPRPELGWCWQAHDAERIRSMLSAQISP